MSTVETVAVIVGSLILMLAGAAWKGRRTDSVHRYMSDVKRSWWVPLAWCGGAYLLYRSGHANVGAGMFIVWGVAMLLFGSKWIGGRPEDFPDSAGEGPPQDADRGG